MDDKVDKRRVCKKLMNRKVYGEEKRKIIFFFI